MLNRLKRGIKKLTKSVNDAACAATKAASDIYKTKCEVDKFKWNILKDLGDLIKNPDNRVQIGYFVVFAGIGLITSGKFK